MAIRTLIIVIAGGLLGTLLITLSIDALARRRREGRAQPTIDFDEVPDIDYPSTAEQEAASTAADEAAAGRWSS